MLSFLSDLGRVLTQDAQAVGRGVATGAKAIGSGIKGGVSKITNLGQGGGEEGGGFDMPEEGGDAGGSFGAGGGDSPLSGLLSKIKASQAAAPVSTSTNPGDIPVQIPQPQQSALPPGETQLKWLGLADSPPAIQSSAPSNFPNTNIPTRLPDYGSSSQSARMASLGSDPSAIAPPQMSTPQIDTDRTKVAIPQLPGREGPPRPYDPRTEREYDWMMKRIPLEKQAGVTSNGTPYESDVVRKPTGGERLKAGLRTAGLGSLRSIASAPPGSSTSQIIGRGIGGGGAGMVAGAYSPAGAAQYQYDTLEAPQVDKELARTDEYQKSERADRMAGLGEQAAAANVEHTRASTAQINDSILSGKARDRYMGVPGGGLYDTKDQYWVREPVDNTKPQIRNVVDDDGVARTYAVYPDGRQEYLGNSERAKIAADSNQTRQGIAAGHDKTSMRNTDTRQSGATGRTAMTQSGQDRRAAAKGTGASGGSIRQKFIQKAVAVGHSRAAAEAEANKRGLK